MTREEYKALLAQKEAVALQLKDFSHDICEILSGLGLENDGKAEVSDMYDKVARIAYLKRASHGSCCCDEWKTAIIPVHWLFGGDWKSEHAARQAEDERMAAERVAASAEQDRLELEQKDLQRREGVNLISVLIQYIHDLKRHQCSIQLCMEEPCPATLEFLGKTEKRVVPCRYCGFVGCAESCQAPGRIGKRKDQAQVCDSCGWNNGPEGGGGSRVMYSVGKVVTCEHCIPTSR